MSQVYRKPHSYRRKKPILKNRFFWLGILIFLTICLIFYSLVFSNFFQTDKVVVEGAEKIPAGGIEQLAGGYLEKTVLFFKTKSIFLVRSEEIEKQILASYPLADEVRVSRRLPDTVKIFIKEKTAVALWCGDDGCFELDKKGVIFQEATVSSDLIKIKDGQEGAILGDSVIEEGLLMSILDINSKLKQKADLLAEAAEIVSASRLDILTSEGWEAYFNLSGDLDWQITELALVLEKEISPAKRRTLDYIDLRFSKVYYK
jgi:cell division protein FtsQ